MNKARSEAAKGFLCYCGTPMSKPMLRDLTVTPEDISSSFHEKHKRLPDYLEVMRHARQSNGNALGSFAKQRGISRTKNPAEYAQLVNWFRNWVQGNKPPLDVQTLCELNELNILPSAQNAVGEFSVDRLVNNEILPFNFKSPLFGLIALFRSYIFWRGGNSAHVQDTGHTYAIHRADVDEVVFEMMTQIMGRHPKLDVKSELVLMSGTCARFMSTIGGPLGRKTSADEPLTAEVALSMHSLESNDAPADELAIAQRTVRDFVLALFHAGKFRQSEKRGGHVILPFSASQETAEERSTGFLRALRHGGFDTDVSLEHTVNPRSGADGMTPTYSHIVSLRSVEERDRADFLVEFRARVFDRRVSPVVKEEVSDLPRAQLYSRGV